MKNLRIRKAMLEASMTQSDLAELLGKSRSYVSMLLNYELAKVEQDDIIRLIRGKEKVDA